MGGFGQSESLSAYLRDTLANECGLGGQNIVLDSSKLQWVELRFASSPSLSLTDLSNRSTAVACGAVIRALRKEDGPARILQSSYGFLRTEPYGTQEAHASQKPKPDKIDGLDYIDNTIEWMIHKVATAFLYRIMQRAIRWSLTTDAV
jgi:hypothetical protein